MCMRILQLARFPLNTYVLSARVLPTCYQNVHGGYDLRVRPDSRGRTAYGTNHPLQSSLVLVYTSSSTLQIYRYSSRQ